MDKLKALLVLILLLNFVSCKMLTQGADSSSRNEESSSVSQSNSPINVDFYHSFVHDVSPAVKGGFSGNFSKDIDLSFYLSSTSKLITDNVQLNDDCLYNGKELLTNKDPFKQECLESVLAYDTDNPISSVNSK